MKRDTLKQFENINSIFIRFEDVDFIYDTGDGEKIVSHGIEYNSDDVIIV